MAYSINPNLIKAREETLRAVIVAHMPICIAARRHGVHRSTIWRWIRRWREINCNVKDDRNYGRPTRPHPFNEKNYCWKLPTCSSAPKTHPRRISDRVVERIMALRTALNRCAIIIHTKLSSEGISVSVSTIERVIAKFCTLKTKRRHVRWTLPRPDVTAPGDGYHSLRQ